MQNFDPLADSHMGATRQANNGANLLSLHPAANVPLTRPPGSDSPRRCTGALRAPSSPSCSPLTIRRSASTTSLNRSQSPALSRKSSTPSIRDNATPGTPRKALSRRSSLNPAMASPVLKSPLSASWEEKPPLRACDIAEQYFEKELACHEGSQAADSSGTIVIVHDQCYGHRFSRPKTSKGTLGLIMERPERMLASVVGISAAYVRLGERHAQGSYPPHPDHSPPQHVPFKIRKTSRLVDITSPVVTNVHGSKWMSELRSLCDNAERKLASTGKELTREASSMPGQVQKRELHSGDLYLCSESMNAFQGALGGVLDAVDAVFQNNGPSRAFVCIRPPGHHCSDDHPSGFCWLNNVHIGIEHAMMQYGLTHAAIIDFDLHHGDGSQAITWARNKKVQHMPKNTPHWKKSSIGYFSLHDINSYPCEDGDDDKIQAASLCIDSAHGQSIWNVHLQPWKTLEQFWTIYEEKYLILLEKARLFLRHHTNRLHMSPNHPSPKAAIFLSAGFDASEWETAGMQRHAVNVPTEFYARFTRDVVRLAEEEGTATGGRVISVLEGGYSDRALTSGVLSHLSGLCDGQLSTATKPPNGLALDMSQRLGGLAISDETEAQAVSVTYSPRWWHVNQLLELENLVNPPPVVVSKKARTAAPAHFSSPTQSFTAKVVDPLKISRNMPGNCTAASSPAASMSPPEVDWATAAYALSKLLIPSNRQTRSHRTEDLAEPKVKREKVPAPALVSAQVGSTGRQLRGRKAGTSYAELDSGNEKALRVESRGSRRKTIADFPTAFTEPVVPARTASRRMSIASSVSSIGERSNSRATSTADTRQNVLPSVVTVGGPTVKKTKAPISISNSYAPARPSVPYVAPNYKSKAAATTDQENDIVDALTTGLKRITLKMPSKEEYEAREKVKEEKRKISEAAKGATVKTATRKVSAARAPTAKTVAKNPVSTTTAVKRGPGRLLKSSKVDLSNGSTELFPEAEVHGLPSTSTASLQQPGQTQSNPNHVPEQAILQGLVSQNSSLDSSSTPESVKLPAEPRDVNFAPQQVHEQKLISAPSIEPMHSTTHFSLTDMSSTPLAMPFFVNYTAKTFDPASGRMNQAVAKSKPRAGTPPESSPMLAIDRSAFLPSTDVAGSALDPESMAVEELPRSAGSVMEEHATSIFEGERRKAKNEGADN